WLPDLLGWYPNAFWFRPSVGVHDPLKVRGLDLESGNVRVLWLAVDLVGIDPTLISELRQRLARRGLGYSAVIVSASHTHSGPGAYASSWLFGFLAVDRLSPAVRGRILDGLESAARQAGAHKVTARVAFGHAQVSDIVESRVQQALDVGLGLVKVATPEGRLLAVIWNYAVHGTSLGRDNFLISGDLMGEAGAPLVRGIGARAVVAPGAVGGGGPRPRGGGGGGRGGGGRRRRGRRRWREG